MTAVIILISIGIISFIAWIILELVSAPVVDEKTGKILGNK